MKIQGNEEKDGSQFDMRDSELKSMGELYVSIHDAYLITLQQPTWQNMKVWLDVMRVFHSYVEEYGSDGSEDLSKKVRKKILDMDQKIEDGQNFRDEFQAEAPSTDLLEEMEDIKSTLEKLRDSAGFTLPMNSKVDPESAGVDQL